jgi:hypothetical protein
VASRITISEGGTTAGGGEGEEQEEEAYSYK